MPRNSNQVRGCSQERIGRPRKHPNQGLNSRSNLTLGKTQVARPGHGLWNGFGGKRWPDLGLGHGVAERLKEERSERYLEASCGVART